MADHEKNHPAGEPADPSQQAAAKSSLQDQLAAALEERDANYNRYLRAEAETDTIRRRAARELDEQRRYQSLSLLKDLLPALDNLHRAVDAAKAGTDVKVLKEGVQMVLKQFDDVFSRHDAKPIKALGQPFDPNLHEAISQMPSPDKPPMTVLIEAEKGYTLHDRVVRPSKVVVAAPNG